MRGSRHAWDIRLISVDALSRLMLLKQEMIDPQISEKVRAVLLPREFTRVDGIIELVFSAARRCQGKLALSVEDVEEIEDESKSPRFRPVAFHQACIERIERSLEHALVARSKAIYGSADGSLVVFLRNLEGTCDILEFNLLVCVSPSAKGRIRRCSQGVRRVRLWLCGRDRGAAVSRLRSLLEGMHKTILKDGRFYWHVKIYLEDGRFVLHRKSGFDRIDVHRVRAFRRLRRGLKSSMESMKKSGATQGDSASELISAGFSATQRAAACRRPLQQDRSN